jgi:peptide/nickel transport system substrate-binding protein/oligopeptide transport system substrate-binding protein
VKQRAFAVAMVLASACTSAGAGAFPQPVPGAHRGGVLRVGITAPGSVDPGNDYEPSGDLVIRTMCDALLTTDPRDGTLRAGLAESWVVTANGAKVVLRLRKGLRFSDGTPLTSADVVYSLSRVASADYASAAADQLRLIAGFDQVHGDVETSNDSERRRLAGVRASDKRTVEISLTRPYADFVRVLALRVTAPLSMHAAESDPRGFARRPVCVGPYRLAEPFIPGSSSVRLVRSASYTATDGGLTRGGTGYADEVRFRIYATSAAAAAAEKRGEIDVAPATPADAAQSGPGPELEYVGLPTTTAPFDRPEVRRALALALSRTELVRRVFPTTRVPATGFLPPTTGAARACDDLPPAGDVVAAARLLATAGVDLRGLRVPLLFNDELRNRALVTEVARQWRAALGLVAVPTPLTFSAFLAQGRATRGFGAPFRFSWAADDVDGYLTPLFSTDGVGRDNLSRYSDPTIDEALKRRAWRAVDPADRALAYRRIADLLCAAMPMVPLTTSLHRIAVAARVASASGTFVDGSTGQVLLRELYLR